MKRTYQKPNITLEVIELEHSVAASSDCKGAHQGQGHGNGKGCKGPGVHDYQIAPPEDNDLIM